MLEKPKAANPNEDAGEDKLLGVFDTLLRNLALWIGGFLLIVMVGLTFAHVIMRYIFANPIHGFVDMGQIMLVLVVAFTVAYSGRTGGQIAVEIIDTMVSKNSLRWIEVVTRIGGSIMIAILSWKLFADGPEATEMGEATTTLGVSHEPLLYTLGVGMGLYAIVLILEATRLIAGRPIGQEQARLFKGDSDDAI